MYPIQIDIKISIWVFICYIITYILGYITGKVVYKLQEDKHLPIIIKVVTKDNNNKDT